MYRQPDDVTCGPTCLHAVYRYFGLEINLKEVIQTVPNLGNGGGTLSVLLALDALKRGFNAKIYTFNLLLFDPSWFKEPSVDLKKKLISQAKAKNDTKLHIATHGYLEYLDRGGEIFFEDLTPGLLEQYLNQSVPILTGLSSTYLYRAPRERSWDDSEDDIRGGSAGHFVVLSGYDSNLREVMVADPLHGSPNKKIRKYPVEIHRLICAILLGVLTYDGNLLIIKPFAKLKQSNK